MLQFSQVLVPKPVLLVAVLVGALGLGACKKPEVTVRVRPKDVPFAPKKEAPEPGPEREPEPSQENQAQFDRRWRPALKYELPAGWADSGPDQANVGRFMAGDLSVAVTALASFAGHEFELVDMYRRARKLPPVSDADAAKALVDVPIGSQTGKLIEISHREDNSDYRFLLAILNRPEGSLFIKVQGDDAKVLAQRPAFLEFLKKLEVAPGQTPAPEKPATAESPPPPTAEATPKEPAPAPVPEGTPPPKGPSLPPGWVPLQAGNMQVAKFQLPEKDGGKAEVAVSIFNSEAGGTLSNVKRWRDQLGLPAIDDAAALALAKPLEGAPAGSVIIHLENGARALSAAIVPRAGEWWFFKLTGDTPSVRAAADTFTAFAKVQP